MINSITTPIYRTSTFKFSNCEEGEKAFQRAYGLIDINDEKSEYIYSRVSNPNNEILERKIASFDGAEDCLVFPSGLSAISTTLLCLLNPGDTLLYTKPLYGGSLHFIEVILKKFNINTIPIKSGYNEDELRLILENNKIDVVFVETPSNPLLELSSIRLLNSYKKDYKIVVDNTMLGPIFTKPMELGADCVIYSLTKFFTPLEI